MDRYFSKRRGLLSMDTISGGVSLNSSDRGGILTPTLGSRLLYRRVAPRVGCSSFALKLSLSSNMKG